MTEQQEIQLLRNQIRAMQRSRPAIHASKADALFHQSADRSDLMAAFGSALDKRVESVPTQHLTSFLDGVAFGLSISKLAIDAAEKTA